MSAATPLREAFVFDAVRTPRGKGKPGAPMSKVLPHQLVAQLVDALRHRRGPGPLAAVDQLNLSCVGQVGPQGGHLALVAKLEAKLPDSTRVQTINNYCVGGLTAIANAALAVRAGDVDLALAGGVEQMSLVPFLGDGASFITDPAVAAHLRYAPPGIAADHLAFHHDVTTAELDAVAVASHRRAAQAWDDGRYDRWVVPVTDGAGTVLSARDETIVADMTLERIRTLPPVFEQMGREHYDAVVARNHSRRPVEHRHTIAHCPPIADGAALVLLGSAEAGARHGLEPLARLSHVVEAAADPIEQLGAGVVAMERLFARGGFGLEDIDVIEYMEAFAVVPALFQRTYSVEPAAMNVNGGHLAMGHPMGATGAILVTAVVAELQRTGARRGLTVAHGGSGVGVAAVLDAP